MTPLLNLVLVLLGGCNTTSPLPPLSPSDVGSPFSIFNANSSSFISLPNKSCKCDGKIFPNLCEMFQKLGLCGKNYGDTIKNNSQEKVNDGSSKSMTLNPVASSTDGNTIKLNDTDDYDDDDYEDRLMIITHAPRNKDVTSTPRARVTEPSNKKITHRNVNAEPIDTDDIDIDDDDDDKENDGNSKMTTADPGGGDTTPMTDVTEVSEKKVTHRKFNAEPSGTNDNGDDDDKENDRNTKMTTADPRGKDTTPMTDVTEVSEKKVTHRKFNAEPSGTNDNGDDGDEKENDGNSKMTTADPRGKDTKPMTDVTEVSEKKNTDKVHDAESTSGNNNDDDDNNLMTTIDTELRDSDTTPETGVTKTSKETSTDRVHSDNTSEDGGISKMTTFGPHDEDSGTTSTSDVTQSRDKETTDIAKNTKTSPEDDGGDKKNDSKMATPDPGYKDTDTTSKPDVTESRDTETTDEERSTKSSPKDDADDSRNEDNDDSKKTTSNPDDKDTDTTSKTDVTESRDKETIDEKPSSKPSPEDDADDNKNEDNDDSKMTASGPGDKDTETTSKTDVTKSSDKEITDGEHSSKPSSENNADGNKNENAGNSKMTTPDSNDKNTDTTPQTDATKSTDREHSTKSSSEDDADHHVTTTPDQNDEDVITTSNTDVTESSDKETTDGENSTRTSPENDADDNKNQDNDDSKMTTADSDDKNNVTTSITDVTKPSDTKTTRRKYIAEPSEDYNDNDDDYDDDKGLVIITRKPIENWTSAAPTKPSEKYPSEETTQAFSTTESTYSEETPEPESIHGVSDTPDNQGEEIETKDDSDLTTFYSTITTVKPDLVEEKDDDPDDKIITDDSTVTEEPESIAEKSLAEKSDNEQENFDDHSKETTDDFTTQRLLSTTSELYATTNAFEEFEKTDKDNSESAQDQTENEDFVTTREPSTILETSKYLYTNAPVESNTQDDSEDQITYDHSTEEVISSSENPELESTSSPEEVKNTEDDSVNTDRSNNDDSTIKDSPIINSKTNINEIEPGSSTEALNPTDFSNCLEVDRDKIGNFDNIILQPLEKKTQKKMINNFNDFGINLLKTIFHDNKKNYAVSPINYALSLLMMENGACGEAKKELDTILYLPEQISKKYMRPIKDLVHSLKNINGSKLYVDSKIFLSEEVAVSPKYRELTRVLYESEPLNVDFHNLDDTVRQINLWGVNRTKDHVKNVISDNFINEDTSVLLASVAYFRTNWLKPFNRLYTSYNLFYIDDNKKKSVCMMQQINRFKYIRMGYLKAELVELPLKDNDDLGLKMIVILPDENKTLADVVKNLHKFKYNDFRNNARTEIIDISLPKFKIHSFIDLSDYSNTININKTMSDTTDFCCISESLKVSNIVQKTVLRIYEGECVRPSFRCPDDDSSCLDYRIYFTVNRPFIILVIKNETIIFSGQIIDPSLQ